MSSTFIGGLRCSKPERKKKFFDKALEYEKSTTKREMLMAFAVTADQNDLKLIFDEIFKKDSKIPSSYLRQLILVIMQENTFGIDTFLNYIIKNDHKEIIDK